MTPSPTNILGVKGVGEAGTIASTPAVINAVVDALSHLGVTGIEMPASPERVWSSDPGRPSRRSWQHDRHDDRGGGAMIPAKFDYVRVEARRGASRSRRARRRRKAPRRGALAAPAHEAAFGDPSVLVDVGRLRELSYVRDEGDELAIGALTRHRELETDPMALEHAPVLAHVAGQVGDPQVRHRGTIGGSLAHGDPASDLPAAVLALGGTLVLRGPRASGGCRRRVPPRLSRDGARARRDARGDPHAEGDRLDLVVPEIPPPCTGLGDRRRRRRAQRHERPSRS